MKVTVEIEDELLKKAARLTGIADASELVARGLEALVAGDSATRIALLRGTANSGQGSRRPY
jgi:Arc/MetJ family transcription regulator